MARFVTLFILVLLVLFGLEMLGPVHQRVVEPFTGFIASLSAWLVVPFDESVVAYGRVLRDGASGFAVSIESGCNGVEATIVLIAAVLAYPASWLQKLVAISCGFVAIQAANLLRIISLFYLGQWNLEVFNWIHLYLWPVLIMLDVLVVFVIYLRYISVHDEDNTSVSPA